MVNPAILPTKSSAKGIATRPEAREEAQVVSAGVDAKGLIVGQPLREFSEPIATQRTPHQNQFLIARDLVTHAVGGGGAFAMDVLAHNRAAWNKNVAERNRWTVPVEPDVVARARQGTFELFLTPTKPVPPHWFPSLRGTPTLCLASGGGQQGPLL